MSCEKTTPCNPCEQGCLNYSTGGCVTYTGPKTLFLNIPNGLNLDTIIQGFDKILHDLQNQIDNSITSVNTSSTVTITLSGNGNTEDLTGVVNLSSAAGQILQVLPDGLYVSADDITPGGASFTDNYFDL